MIEIKTVAIFDNGDIHICNIEDEIQECISRGAIIEDREYEQFDGGWYPLGKKPLSEIEQLRLEQAKSNTEMIQLILSLNGEI